MYKIPKLEIAKAIFPLFSPKPWQAWFAFGSFFAQHAAVEIYGNNLGSDRASKK